MIVELAQKTLFEEQPDYDRIRDIIKKYLVKSAENVVEECAEIMLA